MFRPPDGWQRLKDGNQIVDDAEGQQRPLTSRLGGEIGASNGNVPILARLHLDLTLPHVPRRPSDAC